MRAGDGEASAVVRQRVEVAYQRQMAAGQVNSQLGSREIDRGASWMRTGEQLLKLAIARLNLSARASSDTEGRAPSPIWPVSSRLPARILRKRCSYAKLDRGHFGLVAIASKHPPDAVIIPGFSCFAKQS